MLGHIGNTPLVPLRRIGAASRVPILVKCEHLNPAGSVKDRIALAIIDEAQRSGRLSAGDTVIEATAGNTGLGLALVAAARDFRLVCVMPEKMSIDKRRSLAIAGASVEIVPNAPPSDPRNFQRVAERLAEKNGWLLADQFRNPANPAVHERTTAAEIWAQTGGKIGAFVAGAGTGGTLTGVGRFLKSKGSPARIVLADPVGSGLAAWVRTGEVGSDADYAVEGIGASEAPANLDREVVDDAVSITDEETFTMARRLIAEEGLYVGGSSGTAVAAALCVARSDDVRGPVVALLPDAWDRYFHCPWLAD